VTSRIAAIDTTAEFGSLALIENGGVLQEVQLHSPDGFGHVLFPELKALLATHGWQPGDVDCYAAAAGPGSFTGVRVGLSAVKGLAEALGKPVVTISNLMAAAWYGSAPLRAAVLEARRGEVFGAVYSAALELVSPEVVMGFPAWLETLPEGEIEFLSSSRDTLGNRLAGTRFGRASIGIVPRFLAGAVGSIAAARFAAGKGLSPRSADANYIRASDAELLWKGP
jgi:tRNA threonylcarbamoyladenosine biosynthesis protein TsaB